MRKTSFDLPDSMRRQLSIASAAMGLSSGELIRCFCEAGLQSMADHNDHMRVALQLSAMEPSERMAALTRAGGQVETRQAVA
jgi:hypothetical protein